MGYVDTLIALGAVPSSVQRLVLRQAMTLALVGAIIGSVLASIAGAVVNANIFGSAAIDPLAVLGSAALLVAAMLTAGLVPASRAARVDPIVVLRDD